MRREQSGSFAASMTPYEKGGLRKEPAREVMR